MVCGLLSCVPVEGRQKHPRDGRMNAAFRISESPNLSIQHSPSPRIGRIGEDVRHPAVQAPEFACEWYGAY